MACDDEKEKTRLPYEKPRLRIIELAAEEVLAIGCKIDGGGFSVGVSPCIANSCTGVGS